MSCTSALLHPYCSSSDAVITECPSDTSSQIRGYGLTCPSSSCFWEQTSLLRCFPQASLTVRGVQNLLMLPVGVLFAAFHMCTQCSVHMSSASASTQKPSLRGNFPSQLSLAARCWGCNNMCCMCIGALSNFLSLWCFLLLHDRCSSQRQLRNLLCSKELVGFLA